MARLEALIQSADDYALFRIDPLRYAADQGLAENDAIDLFLHGAKCGLFDMEWHRVCAFCAHTVNIAARVQGLAGAGEICISGDAQRFSGVVEALGGCRVISEQASVKGVSEVLEVCRVTKG